MDQFIEGIFNYCDRWCERCAFTSRCCSFALEKKLMEAGEEKKQDKDTFWKVFESFFEEDMQSQKTSDFFEVIQPEESFEDGLALDCDFLEDIRSNNAKESSIFKAAQSYANETFKWVEAYGSQVNGIDLEKSKKQKATDSIEVVQRYAYFISAKLLRALDNEDDVELSVDSDENGSAKIALISINRSIVAWSIIRSLFNKDKQQTAMLIGQLIAIRRATEQAFPRAMEFIRPGFDTE